MNWCEHAYMGGPHKWASQTISPTVGKAELNHLLINNWSLEGTERMPQLIPKKSFPSVHRKDNEVAYGLAKHARTVEDVHFWIDSSSC